MAKSCAQIGTEENDLKPLMATISVPAIKKGKQYHLEVYKVYFLPKLWEDIINNYQIHSIGNLLQD